jgi:hypothetical protein
VPGSRHLAVGHVQHLPLGAACGSSSRTGGVVAAAVLNPTAVLAPPQLRVQQLRQGRPALLQLRMLGAPAPG